MKRNRVFPRAFIQIFAAFILLGLSITGYSSQAESSPEIPATSPGVDINKSMSPSEIQERLNKLTLTDVVNLALEKNPYTRSARADALAASDNYRVKWGDFLPTIGLDGTLSRSQQLSAPNHPADTITSYGPSMTISYLLLDFGSRAGAVENARQLMLNSEWLYQSTIADVVLNVETAFFGYMATKSFLEAEKITVEEAQTNYQVASERHDLGLATIADVLQAQTALSRAQLSYQEREGILQTTRGALALSMGLPANTPYDIEQMPQNIPIGEITDSVEALIGEAVSKRPDLIAAKARVLAANAHVKDVRNQQLPTVRLSGSYGRTYFPDEELRSAGGKNYSDSYLGAISIHFPLFSGLSDVYKTHQAQHQAESELASAESYEQLVIYQVFAAFHGLKTSTQQVKTSDDLLASAQKSEEVALGRYKEGIGSIIDLLAAQSALADARASQIQSRWSWFTALAQLAHDAGILGTNGSNPLIEKISPDQN
jgi:outer membrane protein